jgi:hypothetical protein
MMNKAASIVMKSAKVESITPPSGFTYVEESIARCCKMNGHKITSKFSLTPLYHKYFGHSSKLEAYISIS